MANDFSWVSEDTPEARGLLAGLGFRVRGTRELMILRSRGA